MAKGKKKSSGSELGYEAQLWQMADALRNNMDAAEYKHVVLGLIFLKYISDAFEAKHAELAAKRGEGADAEDPDEYRAVNIFWVPPGARWAHLKASAPQPTIGQIVDEAMAAIERDNPSFPPSTVISRGIAVSRTLAQRGALDEVLRIRGGRRSDPMAGRVRVRRTQRTAASEGVD